MGERAGRPAGLSCPLHDATYLIYPMGPLPHRRTDRLSNLNPQTIPLPLCRRLIQWGLYDSDPGIVHPLSSSPWGNLIITGLQSGSSATPFDLWSSGRALRGRPSLTRDNMASRWYDHIIEDIKSYCGVAAHHTTFHASDGPRRISSRRHTHTRLRAQLSAREALIACDGTPTHSAVCSWLDVAELESGGGGSSSSTKLELDRELDIRHQGRLGIVGRCYVDPKIHQAAARSVHSVVTAVKRVCYHDAHDLARQSGRFSKGIACLRRLYTCTAVHLR